MFVLPIQVTNEKPFLKIGIIQLLLSKVFKMSSLKKFSISLENYEKLEN